MKPAMFPAAVVAAVLGLIAVEVISPTRTRPSAPKQDSEFAQEKRATMATPARSESSRKSRSDEIEVFHVEE